MGEGKVPLIAIGATGLVGTRIVDLLSSAYSFTLLSRAMGFDVTNKSGFDAIERDTQSEYVLHLAAKTDVDGCEKDKPSQEKGDAWKINVLGIEYLIEACKKSNKKIIYVSTDFVFDGKKPVGEAYSEEDSPSSLNWYGETKLQGEQLLKDSSVPYIILRIAYPYRAHFEKRTDFVRSVKRRLEEKQILKAVEDQIITPTFIDDIADALDVLIKQNATGVFHVVGSEPLSPYDAVHAIAKQWNLDASFIQKITREAFFEGRAQRPFNLALNNDKIKRLGIKMRTFGEGLLELKRQVGNLK